MRQPIRTMLVTVALVTAVASVTRAQTHRLHLGPHAGYNFDVEEFFIGAQFSVPIAYRIEFYPSFDYYFVDPGSLWSINGDFKWRVAHDRPNWLYIGAGLNVTRFDGEEADDTDVGLNLLAGVEPLRGRIHPFLEGKLIIGDNTGFQLQAGLNITISP